MKLQILPNWCKKLSTIFFCVLSVLVSRDDFLRGYYSASKGLEYGYDSAKLIDLGFESWETYFGDTLYMMFHLCLMFSVVIFLISKEIIEDDYIAKLRLESYQLSFFIVTVGTMLFSILGWAYNVDVTYVIVMLLLIYLIVFAIKKRII